ncbi:putative allantoinase [Helianthus anomalus]
MENHQNSPFDRPSQVFNGIRFVLLGYVPLKNSQFVNGGAVSVGKYGPNCTHVIVDKLVYDGDIDILSSDHSPSDLEHKLFAEGDFFRAWAGLSSFQVRYFFKENWH